MRLTFLCQKRNPQKYLSIKLKSLAIGKDKSCFLSYDMRFSIITEDDAQVKW